MSSTVGHFSSLSHKLSRISSKHVKWWKNMGMWGTKKCCVFSKCAHVDNRCNMCVYPELFTTYRYLNCTYEGVYVQLWTQEKEKVCSPHYQFTVCLPDCSPSASSILGMSRYFSATSKAVFRLVMGSSCGQQTQQRSNTFRLLSLESAGSKDNISGKMFVRSFQLNRC